MTEIKVEDVLIPLLKNHYDKLNFNIKFNADRINPKPLYLKDDFGFSINFIHIITSNKLNGILNSLKDPKMFKHIIEDKNDCIDNLLLNENGMDLFNRNIFEYLKEIEIVMENCDHTIKKFQYGLFINIAEIKYEKYNKIPYHIISLILTSFNHNENSNLCNKQIINLVKKNRLYLFSWKKIPGNDNARLIEFLILNFSIEWVKEAKINKNDDGTIISVTNDKNFLSLTLNNEKTNVNLEIDDGRTDKFIVKTENGELNIYNNYSFLNDLPTEIKNILEKDTFVAIQLWNDRWKSEKDNIFDAKTYVEKNPYYFYSILTSEENIFRRTYENIMDVLGWCQSASSAYFDVFYGTTCLELTVKPNKKLFNETGHDSEEFRIWELLALQKKILGEINQKEMNNVDNCIKELDLIYNFNNFTKKKGKGEKWIRYGKYLQKITGIDSDYHDYKLKNEMKNKEHEKKLQQLNIFIIISIFISFLTLLLSPIYSSWVSTYHNDLSLNSTINSTISSTISSTINSTTNPTTNPTTNLYFTHIFKNQNPEYIAIFIASILTLVSMLTFIDISNMYVKISEKIKQYPTIEKFLKVVKYLIYPGIFLLIIIVILFFN